MAGIEKENARDTKREDDSFSSRPRKINKSLGKEGNMIKGHTERVMKD